MRNVEEANHILYGCIVMGSNPILTAIILLSQISATFATDDGTRAYLP